MKIAGSMPASASRADNLLLEHAATERSSSLGYIAELIIVDDHARLALEAHDVRASMVERLQARRARLAELIAEVQRATERMTKSLRLLRLALELTP